MSAGKSYDLTENQIGFGCALPFEFCSVRSIRQQACEDGFPMERVRWQKLVDLGIAELDQDSCYYPRLRRGPQWSQFYKEFGEWGVTSGLDMMEARQSLDQFPQILPDQPICPCSVLLSI